MAEEFLLMETALGVAVGMAAPLPNQSARLIGL
jgi:hypothetical protein